MKEKLKSLPFQSKRLLAVCYSIFVIGSVLACLFSAAEDGVQRALGNVQQQEVSMTDFEWIDLEQNEENTYYSTSYDPRLILTNPPEYVRTITVSANFINLDPGEFCVFYKPEPDMEEFDANYRVWAKENDDGTYSFTLPNSKVYGLRFDPGIYAGIIFTIDSITLNAPQSLFARFIPTRVWLLALLVIPAFIASIVQYLASVFIALRTRKEGK